MSRIDRTTFEQAKKFLEGLLRDKKNHNNTTAVIVFSVKSNAAVVACGAFLS